MAHPGDDRSFGSLLDRDALRLGDRAAFDRCGMIGDGTRQALGEIRVFFVKLTVARSAFRSARIRSMVAAEAHTPLEKTLRPFLSCITQ
jgi:hypothetical protein